MDKYKRMTAQIVFSLSYVPFVILIAMSCLHIGETAKKLKILSRVCAAIAIASYVVFIKNIL